ncbi:MAG: hypothetical protein KC492_31690, partial [Myxococcales bacterium]|nr:hypothetical protein [Myxococcales bacterium]
VGGSAPSAVPPPVGIPKPVGVPAPPFAAPASAPSRPAPRVDASDPYAAIEADQAPVRAEPQAIKVEMSEEVVAAQKKGKVVLVVIGVVGAAIGGLLGFTIGDRTAKNQGAMAAIEDAARLAKEIDDSNAQASQLADVLQAAGTKLGSNKFPDEEVSKLGELRINFTGANLAGSNIGRFKPQLVTQLVEYSSRTQEANDQKEALQSILGGSKKVISELLAEKTDPKVRWSVYMGNGGRGPWAVMQPLPASFAVNDKKAKDYTWPKEFEIKQDGKAYKLKRYTGGDPTKGGGEPQIIPVDPGSQGDVCPNDTMTKLRREVASMQEILKGRTGETADQEKPGLISLGESLVEQLKAIGAHAE